MRYDLIIGLGLILTALKVLATAHQAAWRAPGKRSPLRHFFDFAIAFRARHDFRQRWQLAGAQPARARELLCMPQNGASVAVGARPNVAAEPTPTPSAHPLLQRVYTRSAEAMEDLVRSTMLPKPDQMTQDQWLEYLNGTIVRRIDDIHTHGIDVAPWPHLEGDFRL